MKIQLFVAVAAVALAFAGHGSGYPSDLILYSKLDSAADVTSPQVGAAGVFPSSAFTTGVYGQAADVTDGNNTVSFTLQNGMPCEKGCVEFRSKFINARTSYITTDVVFLIFRRIDLCGSFYIGANNGDSQHGFNCNFPALRQFASLPGYSDSYPYSTIFGAKDPKAWHHYAIVWNTNGIAGTTHAVRVYLDGEIVLSTDKDGLDFASYASFINNGPMTFSLGGGNSEALFDEFRVWSTDRTTFPEGPIVPEQEEVVVSGVTAKQHYPWCGKIDIGYTVAGSTDGLQVKITVEDKDNGITYEAKTFDTPPSASVGSHTVVWDATKDGVNKASRNMVTTVSLIVSED